MIKQAWHFLYDNWQTGYDKLTVEIGKKLVFEGTPIVAKQGLHASNRLIDALSHANGNVVTFVECSGTIIEKDNDDKFVCTKRVALWGYDASDKLRLFSRRVAKDALEKYFDENRFGKLDPVIKQWLETGDEDLRSTAYSAADSAADAARSAAWSAARSAARSAAYNAAYNAARSAANSAARSAAWSAAYSAANSAANSAAYNAAYSAARSAQNEMLTSMIVEGAKKRGLL